MNSARWLTTFLFFTGSLFAVPPVVSNLHIDPASLSHSDFRLLFDVSGSYTNVRLRYIVAPGICTGGTGGSIQVTGDGLNRSTGNMALVLSGLTASTTYNFCPEVSSDGGSTWSTGVGGTVTTLPLPSPHPALPVPPLTFDLTPPNTVGYITLLVGTDCSDVQACINIALPDQCNHGYIIKEPVGHVETRSNIFFDHEACDVQKFHPADVNTTTSAITYVGHGLFEGQVMQFNSIYDALSAFPASTSCEAGTGLVVGQSFYAHPIDADHFRVYCPDKTTLMVFTDQGSVTQYFGFAAQPRSGLNWIIIRSAAPDSELPPPGSRIDPSWISKMATFEDPIYNYGGRIYFCTATDDGNWGWMNSKIQIGPGIRITTADAPESHTSSDPLAWATVVFMPPETSNIVFRQTFWDFKGTPARVNNGFFWDGLNVGLVDSYLHNMTYFHSMNSSTISQTSGSVYTIATGVANGGGGNITVPTHTGTISGTGTGTVYEYLDMLNGNALTYLHPANVTIACSGATCINAGVAGASTGTCALWDGSRGNWPVDSNNNPTVIPVGCINVTSGAITSVQQPDVLTSEYDTEGSNFMIGGRGPGPYMVVNNHMEGAGLMWHHDEGGGPGRVRANYTYTHNTIQFPFKFMYGHPLSDGLSYLVRQPLEWKSGTNILLDGNIFDGAWAEQNPVAGFVVFTSVGGQGSSDINIQNNTFKHGPGVIQGPELVFGGGQLTNPVNRYRFANNLAYDINVNGPVGGWYWVNHGFTNGPNGWLTQGPMGTEDWIIDHNTIVGQAGRLPSLFWTSGVNTEGVHVTNNFMYLWSVTQGVGQELGDVPSNACSGLAGQGLADCTFTPQQLISNNVFQSGDANQATLQSWWPSGLNIIPANMSLNSNGWYRLSQTTGGNYRLQSASQYISGGIHHASDGLDIGADIDAIEAAQGHVVTTGVSGITSTAAQINFVAPDTHSCPIYLATSPWPTDATGIIPTFAITVDLGTRPGIRNISLSSLTPHTVYYAKIMCAVEQPTLLFKTN
jgi:hypothetical protein